MRTGSLRRILTGLSLPLALVLLWIYEMVDGKSHKCLFYAYTGLYCPGCGSGRAVYALFHGKPQEVASNNILLIILGIPCIAILLHEYLRIVIPALALRPVKISQRMLKAIVVMIVAFWVLRNIPAFSFLAPVPGLY